MLNCFFMILFVKEMLSVLFKDVLRGIRADINLFRFADFMDVYFRDLAKKIVKTQNFLPSKISNNKAVSKSLVKM